VITKIDVEGGSGNIPSGPMQFKNDWCGVFLRGDDLIGIEIELTTPGPRWIKVNRLLEFIKEAHSESGAKMTPESFIRRLKQEAEDQIDPYQFAGTILNLLEEYKGEI
jgi:hypothetical protein